MFITNVNLYFLEMSFYPLFTIFMLTTILSISIFVQTIIKGTVALMGSAPLCCTLTMEQTRVLPGTTQLSWLCYLTIKVETVSRTELYTHECSPGQHPC